MSTFINAYQNIDMDGKVLKKGSIVNFSFVGGLEEISRFSLCSCHAVGPLIGRVNLRSSAKRPVETYRPCLLSFCSLSLL